MNLRYNNALRIKIIDFIRHTDQISVYKKYLSDQYQYDKEDIMEYQKKKFADIFRHHFEKNKTYRDFVLSVNHSLAPDHFNLEDIPVITKSFFREHLNNYSIPEEILTTKYSGGTTGNPLRIDLSKDALSNFWPAIWRAFDVYNISPCEKVMMIAGTSLFNNRTFKRKIYEFVNNFTVISAFDLTPDILLKACQILESHKIKVIYGYTSSILYFLNFLEENNIYLNLKCIFTTSETFIPRIRILAEKYCHCDVIDTYGANDGGIFGFECRYHTGYHLNFERCLVEIIDHKIVCTDLLNTAAPFIRYQVGDYTDSDRLITEKCTCGRNLFRIENIAGRINNYIIDKDGKHIHTAFFNQLFSTDLSIKQYQITSLEDKLIINIVCNPGSDLQMLFKKYDALVKRRFKIPFTIVFNQDIEILPNGKVPILI